MSTQIQAVRELDCKGLLCPMPIIKLSQAIKQIRVGETLVMETTDPGSRYDVGAWARQTRHDLIDIQEQGRVYRFQVRRTH